MRGCELLAADQQEMFDGARRGNWISRPETRAAQYETAVVTGPAGDRDTSGFYCGLMREQVRVAAGR